VRTHPDREGLMFTFEARLVLLVALVAGVAAAAAAGTDVLVAVLFAGACGTGLLLGLLVVGTPVDPREPGEAAAPEAPATGPGALRASVGAFPTHSVWPPAAALAAVALAVGLVAAPRVAALAAAAAVSAGLGWALQPRAVRGLAAAGVPAALAGAAALAFCGVLVSVGSRTAAAMALSATVGALGAAFVTARPGISALRAATVFAASLAGAAVAGAVVSAAADRRLEATSLATAVALVGAAGLVVAGFVLAGRPSVGAASVVTAVAVVAAVAFPLGALGAALSGPRRGGQVAGPRPRPAASGRAVYATFCASCHGARGEGGVGPKLAGGEAKLTFPNEADHVNWVKTGSVAFAGKRYGDPNRPGGQHGPATGGMPGFGAQLSDEEIKAVVAYERGGL
jgi:mono/diheme cytochrome c family protein